MTVINQPVALRRFHQGLEYLLEMKRQGKEDVNSESVLAVVAIMAYLGAYAFPGDNLYHLRARLTAALDSLGDGTDVKTMVDRATELAEVFRRPWSEPGAGGEPTI